MSQSPAGGPCSLGLVPRGTSHDPLPSTKDPETWEQPPNTLQPLPMESVTTRALAPPTPGEVSVWLPGWRAPLSSPYRSEAHPAPHHHPPKPQSFPIPPTKPHGICHHQSLNPANTWRSPGANQGPPESRDPSAPGGRGTT